MIFLPIVVRELRVAARRRGTYRARFWTGCVAIAVASYITVASGALMGRTQGVLVFSTIASLCFLLCLTQAAVTSDCISEEKREGTLGFLFLTDLKGHDIALGKLMSCCLVSFYSLLGIFPVVAISLLLGGVSAVAFWAAALALLNVFFFANCAGLFISALSRKRNSANSATVLLLALYTAGFFMLFNGLKEEGYGPWITIFEWLNPAYCLHWACTMGLNPIGPLSRQFSYYGRSLLLVHLNAWVFLAAASWRLPRCWQEKTAGPRIRMTERFRRWYHARFTARGPLLDKNPFLWLAIRNRLGPLGIWAILIGLGFIWAWLIHHFTFKDAGIPMLTAAIIVNHLLLKLLAASEAANCLEEQRHSGALELLLGGTPLSVAQIIDGQWRALRRHFFWPIAAVLVSDIAILWVAEHYVFATWDNEDRVDYTMFMLAIIPMLILDLHALGWAGMWNAMSRRRPRNATGAAVLQILFLPWTILIALQTITGIAGHAMINRFGVGLALWFLLGMGTDIAFVLYFRPRLLAEFRDMAAPQAGEELGLFGRFGRFIGMQFRAKSR